MQKDVVILSSSPRKYSNSDLLCDRFADGAGEAGHRVEKIVLRDRTLESFRGFTACLDDPIEKGVIYGTGAWKAGEIKDSAAMTESYAMGRNA